MVKTGDLQVVKDKLKSLVRAIRQLGSRSSSFSGSEHYWDTRYEGGGDSGAGSYGRLSRFKADTLNAFTKQHKVQSVIEFGCGDGHQLSLAHYPQYVGIDVSPKAIEMCKQRFQQDQTKSFYLYDTQLFDIHSPLFVADLGLSLDVVYHLVEDNVFENYMRHLFAVARRYVIVYSSNWNGNTPAAHVRHRQFTSWIEEHALEWRLVNVINNAYPYDESQPDDTSFADFFIYANKVS